MAELLTIKDIAEREGLSPTHVSMVTLKKGFPEPEKKIGKNKMFDPKKVAKYFEVHKRK